jgi:hypothetical protein
VKITVEPTEEFFMAGVVRMHAFRRDVMCRMWQGSVEHDDGSTGACVALISMLTFPGQAEDSAEGLVSIPPPTEEAARRWATEHAKEGAEVLSKRYE